MTELFLRISMHDIFIVITFVIMLIFLLTCVYYLSFDKNLVGILIISLLFMLLMLFIHAYYFPLPFSGNDDARFEKLALNFYNSWIGNTPLNIFQNSYFYSLMIGVFYYFLGVHELIPGLINIFTYILVITFSYKIYLLVFESKKGLYMATFLVSFSIVNIVFTVITLREVQVTLALVLLLYLSLLFHKTKNPLCIIAYIIVCFIGAQFHIGVLGCLIFIAVQYHFETKSINKFIFPLMIIIGLIGALVISSDQKIDSVLNGDENVLNDSSEPSNADYQVPFEGSFFNPIASTIKVTYFLIQPLPWKINSLSGVVGFILNLSIIYILYKVFKLYKETHKKEILIAFLYILFCLILFALGTSNYGTGFRHKHKLIILLILFLPSITVYRNYFRGVFKENVSHVKNVR